MHVKNTNHTNKFNVFLFVVYRFEVFLAGLQFGSPGLILKSLKKKLQQSQKCKHLWVRLLLQVLWKAADCSTRPLYAVIFTLPGLRRPNSGSVREPSGNGICFLRKNLTLASSTFTLQSRLDAQWWTQSYPADNLTCWCSAFYLKLCTWSWIIFLFCRTKLHFLLVRCLILVASYNSPLSCSIKGFISNM